MSPFISRVAILVFGLLYPAYASYKAVNTRNIANYTNLMMYWIVFAIFTCTETITDTFFNWFPLYYEIKMVLICWLLSPSTNGSGYLYRNFVHPTLRKREEEIDDYIARVRSQSYTQLFQLTASFVLITARTLIRTVNWASLVPKNENLFDIVGAEELFDSDENSDIVLEEEPVSCDNKDSFYLPPAKCTRSTKPVKSKEKSLKFMAKTKVSKSQNKSH